MSPRLSTVAVGASLVPLLLVSTAGAKVYFSGVPETAAPGTVVRAYVSGCEAAPACGTFVRGTLVYLARARAGQAGFDGPPRPRWLVGRVDVRGKLTFRVPRVRDGDYRLIARLRFGNRFQYLPASSALGIRAPDVAPEEPAQDAATDY